MQIVCVFRPTTAAGKEESASTSLDFEIDSGEWIQSDPEHYYFEEEDTGSRVINVTGASL